jgi:hypothetical protein
MKWSDKHLHPDRRTLQQFGGLSVAFLSYGAFVHGYLRHQPNLAVVFAGLAAVMGVLALIKPSFIRPIYVGAMVITFPIGWTISRVLLGLIYYGLITPIALIFRLIGRDALYLKHHSDAKTYWLPKVISTDPKRYFRMY